MENKNTQHPASQGKKPEANKPTDQNSSNQETQQQDETSSPYVDLDKANFTERPYDRPSSLGPDHEPKADI